MLSAALRRGLTLCTSGVRTYARSRRSHRMNANPGLQHRAKAFEEAGFPISPDEDIDELLEESEANMPDMHHAYDQHVQETRQQRDKLRKQIVEQKYWDDQYPNLLTWSEKEQIRYLINERGDEWTPERIAESFPVTPEIVKKLVKYPWQPSTLERIARHDASAMRNWRELKEGTLDIPKELREKFLKFSDRTIPPLKEKSIKRKISKEIIGEFQAIIEKSAAKERQRAQLESEKEEVKENPLIITDESTQEIVKQKQYTNTNKFDHSNKRYTLDELKIKVGREVARGKNVNEIDHYMLSTAEPQDDEVRQVSANEQELQTFNKVKKELTAFKEDPASVAPPEIPDRIRIPKNAYKKGGTYRVNDCYYDYDGRFLYRVPGLTSASGVKQNNM